MIARDDVRAVGRKPASPGNSNTHVLVWSQQ